MSLHAKLQQRAAEGKPDPHRPDRRRQVRLDVPGAGAAHARRAPGRHRRPVARRRAGQPRARRLEAGAHRRPRRSTKRCKTGATHDQRRLAGAGARTRRSTSSSSAPATRSPRSTTAWKPSPTASTWSTSRSRPMPSAARCWRARRARGRRGLFAGLRRPAGADLRPGGLGAHLRLPGGGGRPRPQVAAALQRVDARDGVGPLRPDARAGRSAAA